MSVKSIAFLAPVVALTAACARLPSTLSTDADSTPNVYFRLLHAHTSYSDGAGTPEEAYARAAAVPGLSFFAITEHNTITAEASIRDHPVTQWPRQDGVQIKQ